MSKAEKYAAEAEAWESGALGRDENHVKRADEKHEAALDSELNLQMISIRLQKGLIEDLKFISLAHGIGYQPLIRDILSRFVKHEVKQIIRDTIERRKQEEKKCLEEEKSLKQTPRQKKAA